MRFHILVSIILFDLSARSLAQETEAGIVVTSTSTPETSGPIQNNLDLTIPVIERSGHHAHVHVDPTFKGFWAKKVAWRPRWVKTWQEKKVYVAVWKRMWGPLVVKEWVPVPKPPPGWVKHDAGAFIVKKFPHH